MHVPTLKYVHDVVAKQLRERESAGAEQQVAALVEALQSLLPSESEAGAWTSADPAAVRFELS